jgi:hypothetical protein
MTLPLLTNNKYQVSIMTEDGRWTLPEEEEEGMILHFRPINSFVCHGVGRR